MATHAGEVNLHFITNMYFRSLIIYLQLEETIGCILKRNLILKTHFFEVYSTVFLPK